MSKTIHFILINKLLSIFFLFASVISYCQDADSTKKNTPNVVISLPENNNIIASDTVHQNRENSLLDIEDDRGIYIITEKGKLQFRILGSVRYSAFYDFKNVPSKNSFNYYEIPTGDANIKLPNYYNNLNFSRFGFEVTRKTNNGDFFIRLEMDFSGPDNAFRIRHAYGKYKNYIIGQTWSLLTNVEILPASVDPDGPVGALAIRTPQFRVSYNLSDKLYSAFAIEYSLPDYNPPDSINVQFVQTIPNLLARFNTSGNYASFQLAGILAPITGVQDEAIKKTVFGYGLTFSGMTQMKKNDQLLFQATFGNAIAHMINPFSGSGQDMAYNASNNTFKGLSVLGGFLSYVHHWPHNISSYFSLGYATIGNRYFQNDSDFSKCYSISANAFWNVVEGLKVGVEGLFGERFNIDNTSGTATRIWILFYYDF